MPSLLSKPVPPLNRAQIEKFTVENIRSSFKVDFSAAAIVEKAKQKDGQKVLAFDIGGNKIDAAFFEIGEGRLKRISDKDQLKSSGGEGYLAFMKRYALGKDYLVGVSAKSVVEGKKLVPHPDLQKLNEDLAEFEGDLSKVIPNVTIVNDAVSAAIGGGIGAMETGMPTEEIVQVINGAGIGGSYIKDGKLYATEVGHVEVVSEFNPFGQQTQCGFLGQEFICIERLGGGLSIEDIYRQKTGRKASGQEISRVLVMGNQLAFNLYDNSSLIVAHVVVGMKESLGLFAERDKTTLVLHGGVFKVPDYDARVRQLLREYLGFEPNILTSFQFSDNACLEGAAIAALLDY